MSVFFYLDPHIVDDVIDALGRLLNFIDHLVLLQHHLSFDLVVDLYLLLLLVCHQRLLRGSVLPIASG